MTRTPLALACLALLAAAPLSAEPVAGGGLLGTGPASPATQGEDVAPPSVIDQAASGEGLLGGLARWMSDTELMGDIMLGKATERYLLMGHPAAEGSTRVHPDLTRNGIRQALEVWRTKDHDARREFLTRLSPTQQLYFRTNLSNWDAYLDLFDPALPAAD